jgi:hypothetical protein
MLFKKVCPRCGRRYPKNFDSCLECGAPLTDLEKEARNQQIIKRLPVLGILLAGGILFAAILFLVVPLVQYSLVSGAQFASATRDTGPAEIQAYSLNQPAADDRIRVTMVRVREGAKSANSNKFILVSALFENLQAGNPTRVAIGDFSLVDDTGRSYPLLSLGEKVSRDIGPLSSESLDLLFEIPQNASGLRIQYRFSGSGIPSGRTVLFLLQ